LRHWENKSKPGGTETELGSYPLVYACDVKILGKNTKAKNANSMLDANEDICAEMNTYVTRKQDKIIT
jgi:hypothetical protein